MSLDDADYVALARIADALEEIRDLLGLVAVSAKAIIEAADRMKASETEQAGLRSAYAAAAEKDTPR